MPTHLPLETLFAIANLSVMPLWLLMILAPNWRFTRRLLRSPLVVLPPIVVYAAVVLPGLAQILPAVARPQLPGVAALLGQPAGALAGWAHFLAFDLFIARWIFLDSIPSEAGDTRPLPAVVRSTLLVLTLLFGPLGLATYFLVRGRARLTPLYRRLAQGHQALAVVAIGSAALLGFALLGQLVDSRTLFGISVWVKPAKFAASVALTAATLALLLPLFPTPGKWVARTMTLSAWLFALELVIITVQAARGVPSHFNAASTFDGALFSLMGIAVTIIWLTLIHLARVAFRQRFASPAQGWGIRLGLVALVLGAGVGGLMPRPTAAQLASLRAHRPTPLVGAHAVGVADGGPGLAVTGWSTEGGDLRVPHFIGMHGLQLLPLLGWWLARARRRGPLDPSGALTAIAGLGFIGLTVVTLVEALRARPLFAPDAFTTMLLVALVAAVTIATAAVLVRRRSAPLPFRVFGS